MKREPIWILGTYMATFIGVLEFGLDGNVATAIHASKKGLRITIGKVTVARGKDARELHSNFEQAIGALRKEAGP
jgi:copper oxidase (laccase) domain-containing protein